MATYGDLQAKIADDMLVGAAVTDQHVQDAILAAIDEYESQRFWFNESRTITFPTVVAQTDYSDASTWGRIIHADYLKLDLAGADRFLSYVRPDHVDWLISSASPSSGEPYLWSNFGSEVRVYPAPNAVYTIRVTGHITYPALSANSDTNVWTNEAFELIRARAKWDLANNITHDDALAGRAAIAEERALDRLRSETGRRTSRGYIEPVCF